MSLSWFFICCCSVLACSLYDTLSMLSPKRRVSSQNRKEMLFSPNVTLVRVGGSPCGDFFSFFLPVGGDGSFYAKRGYFRQHHWYSTLERMGGDVCALCCSACWKRRRRLPKATIESSISSNGRFRFCAVLFGTFRFCCSKQMRGGGGIILSA